MSAAVLKLMVYCVNRKSIFGDGFIWCLHGWPLWTAPELSFEKRELIPQVQQLLRKLVSHGLLLEPFERAAVGLREVYKGKISTSPQNGQKA